MPSTTGAGSADAAAMNTPTGFAALGAWAAMATQYGNDRPITEVDTALGSVEHSSAGEQLVMNTLNIALQRAGSILGRGRIHPADIATIIQHESSGNPHAMNNRDSDTGAGTLSKGMVQTIDPTFAAYSLPGHRNIWDPVDNIVAGVRYAIEHYGSVAKAPGVGQLREGGSHVGY